MKYQHVVLCYDRHFGDLREALATTNPRTAYEYFQSISRESDVIAVWRTDLGRDDLTH